jgi:hypothetical protein
MRIFGLALVALAAATLAARASEFSDDLKARRARAMGRLGADSILVAWSATRGLLHGRRLRVRRDSNLCT